MLRSSAALSPRPHAAALLPRPHAAAALPHAWPGIWRSSCGCRQSSPVCGNGRTAGRGQEGARAMRGVEGRSKGQEATVRPVAKRARVGLQSERASKGCRAQRGPAGCKGWAAGSHGSHRAASAAAGPCLYRILYPATCHPGLRPGGRKLSPAGRSAEPGRRCAPRAWWHARGRRDSCRGQGSGTVHCVNTRCGRLQAAVAKAVQPRPIRAPHVKGEVPGSCRLPRRGCASNASRRRTRTTRGRRCTTREEHERAPAKRAPTARCTLTAGRSAGSPLS